MVASRRYSSGGHGDSSKVGGGGGPDGGDSSYYQRMRERNNEASKRCRLKRRMKTETMEYQVWSALRSCTNLFESGGHSGAKLHAVLPGCKNSQAGILKKSQVLSLRWKNVRDTCNCK